MANLVKQQFKLSDMHCSSCALSIDMDLEEVEGVVSVKTNYYKAVTEVEFDKQKLSESDIIGAIKNTGYTAVVVEN